MSELQALIANLEAAEEGTRELDGRVYCAVNGLVFRSVSNLGFHFEPDAQDTHTHVTPTPFSTSLDAALTLVPEGWIFQLSQDDPNKWRVRPQWYAALENFGQTGANDVYARCHRAALAVCVAALRARAAEAADIAGAAA